MQVRTTASCRSFMAARSFSIIYEGTHIAVLLCDYPVPCFCVMGAYTGIVEWADHSNFTVTEVGTEDVTA
jgi:hypothetical protein